MTGVFEIQQDSFSVNLAKPIDISLPVMRGGVKAWYVSDPDFTPVRANGFVGAVREGGSVNFRDIAFNPHGHGTHTECYGHIAEEVHSIHHLYQPYFGPARLITVTPEERGQDRVITEQSVRDADLDGSTPALIIRTTPNSPEKRTRDYSNSNPPYLESGLLHYLATHNVQHLLVDVPSVDRESDGGKLEGHRAFWNYPEAPRQHATITELVYVPDAVTDGLYVLNLHVAPIENDAAPSRPILYVLSKTPQK